MTTYGSRPRAPGAGGGARPPGVLSVVLVLLVALGAVGGPPRAALAQGPTIPSYRLDGSLDWEGGTLRVGQVTTFRNQSGLPLDRAVFQVAAEAWGVFRLASAGVGQQLVTPRLDGTVLEVPFPTPLSPGGSAEVSLSYQLDLPHGPGRISASRDVVGLGNWFPTLVPHRGDWLRHQHTEVGDAFVTELADFDLRLSSSVPLVVAAGGQVSEEAGSTYRIEARGQRDLALSLSPSYRVAERRVGRTVVRGYSADPARGAVFAETAARFLDWYGGRFGPYPYDTLTLAEVDLPPIWTGMEYPGMIFLGFGVDLASPFEGSPAEELIGHEVAHQWFYGLVGVDQVREPWLDESFAEYLPFYYYRRTAPAVFEAVWDGRVLGGLDERVRAIGSPPLDSGVHDFAENPPYVTTVYHRGARFLDELRGVMGEAAFEAALADQVATFRGKLASPRAVLDLFQRHSPANLNPLLAGYFSYAAVQDPSPPLWWVEVPPEPWQTGAYVFIGAELPLARVELWLDGRRVHDGPENAVTLDLRDVEPGDYLLLVRARDHRDVVLERAQRVTVGP